MISSNSTTWTSLLLVLSSNPIFSLFIEPVLDRTACVNLPVPSKEVIKLWQMPSHLFLWLPLVSQCDGSMSFQESSPAHGFRHLHLSSSREMAGCIQVAYGSDLKVPPVTGSHWIWLNPFHAISTVEAKCRCACGKEEGNSYLWAQVVSDEHCCQQHAHKSLGKFLKPFNLVQMVICRCSQKEDL